MQRSLTFREQCAEAGKSVLADYVCQAVETSLVEPLLGYPDAWPPDVGGRQLLCRDDYAQLPADCRPDYVPAEDHPGHLGEMGRTTT